MRDLSPVALAALAVFAEGPRHAYEVFCVMRDRREEINVRLSAGTLYRAVQQLADDALLAPIGTGRDGNRPERTTYEITAAGHRRLRAQVADMLQTRAEEYPQVLVAVAESHLLGAGEAEAGLQARAEAIDAELATLAEHAEQLEAKALPARFWLDLRLRESLMRAERDWCAQTARDIAAGRIDWTASPCAAAGTATAETTTSENTAPRHDADTDVAPHPERTPLT